MTKMPPKLILPHFPPSSSLSPPLYIKPQFSATSQNQKTLTMANTTPQVQIQAQDEDQYGVLLYYKYTEITDLNSLQAFYESNCNSLGLLGRVRLSPHGVNVTVCTFPLVVLKPNTKRLHFYFFP
jgi:hypothetical protein